MVQVLGPNSASQNTTVKSSGWPEVGSEAATHRGAMALGPLGDVPSSIQPSPTS